MKRHCFVLRQFVQQIEVLILFLVSWFLSVGIDHVFSKSFQFFIMDHLFHLSIMNSALGMIFFVPPGC